MNTALRRATQRFAAPRLPRACRRGAASAPGGEEAGAAASGYMGEWQRENAERRRVWDEALLRRQAQEAEREAEWARMRAAWAARGPQAQARQEAPPQSSRFSWWWEGAPGGRRATPEQAADWQVRRARRARPRPRVGLPRLAMPCASSVLLATPPSDCLLRWQRPRLRSSHWLLTLASLRVASQRRFEGGEDTARAAPSRAAPSDARGHYAALGLLTPEARRADAAALQRAFQKTVIAHHPDTAPAGSPLRFRAAMAAWEVLRDATRRRRYDETGT